MSSIDKLKALLNKKEYSSYKEFHNENPKDAELDEQINEEHGKIPASKVMDKKTLSFFKIKYPKGDYQAFYDPEMADKYKAINKLKALLNKTQFEYTYPCRTCGKNIKILADRNDRERRKKIKEGYHQCTNCKNRESSQSKKLTNTVSISQLQSDPEYQRQKQEYLERRSRGENVGNFKFNKRKNKAIDKLKALLNKEGETNSGEKSHKTDHGEEGKTAENYDNREYEIESEHQHPANPNKLETRKPSTNFYPNFRKFEIDDRDPDDKYYFF